VDSRVAGVSAGLNPSDFLQMLGLEKYSKSCPHLGRPCHFKPIYRVPSKSVGRQVGVRKFDAFVESIHDLYVLADQLARRVGDHSHFVRWGRQFSTEPKVLEIEDGQPNWLAEYWTDGHRKAAEARLRAEADEKHFEAIEYCLWAKDQELEEAVRYTLSGLGLEPRKTEKSAHVDLILEFPARGVEIGMEITGTSGSIGMRSPKMNQVGVYLEECAERDEPCKGVIMANTHNELPPSERTGKQHFTEPAVKAMRGLGIVGLTTVDLYHIWLDVESGEADIEAVVAEICDHKGGVYEYPHKHRFRLEGKL